MGVGTQVASLFGVLALDDSNFQRGAKNATSTLKDLGSGMQQLGGNLTALGAPFLGIAAIGQHAFDEIDDATDQLGAVLKSTGGAAGVTYVQALQLSNQLQDLTGITRATVLGGENMLLTFTNIGHEVFPRATKAALDLSVAMKQDMKSSAIQLGKALNNPIEGITALTRVGVTFSDSQKEMIKTMVEAGNVAGAQGIILAEIEKEFGGSAAAAADPIDHLSATLNDLAINIGAALQPVLEAVIPIISDLAKKLGDWMNAMGENGDETVGIILAIGAGLAIIGPILAVIGTGLTAIGGLIGVLLGPIGLIIGAVILLVKAFQDNFLGIRDFLQPIIDQIVDFFNHFQERVALYLSLFQLYFAYYVTNPLSTFWNQTLKPVFDAFLAWFQTDGLPAIQNALNDFKTNVWDKVVNAVGTIWDAVKGAFKLFSDWFTTGGLQEIIGSITTFKDEHINPIIKTLQDLWTKIQPGLEELKKGLKAVFDWIGTNVIKPITDFIQALIDKANTAIQLLAMVGNGSITVTPGYVTPESQTGVHGPNSNQIQPIPPVGGGSSLPLNQQGFQAGGNVNVQGGIHIHANSEAEGASAMKGALNAARARGY